MITSAIGVQSMIYGAAILIAAAPSATWERLHGLTYVLITASCCTTTILSANRRTRASEIALVATGLVGIVGVLLTSPSRATLIPVICALHIMIMFPGLAVSVLGGRSMLFLTTGVYILGVMLRLGLRPEETVGSYGELLLTVVPPVFSVSIVWMMHRALMER